MTKTSQLQHPLDTPFLQNSGAAMVQPLRIIDDSGKTHLGLLSRATNRGGGEQLKHHTGGALEAEDLKKGPSLGRIQAALREQREETAAIFATFTEEDIERIMDKKYGFDDQQINEVKAAAQVLEKNDLCQKILSMEAGS
ncbi:MAG: hypothetical protein O3B09_03755, partial [Proteobacteria bacterium]|nr:hypothetical protein [Pseudomonadota bacterium]